MSHVTTGEMCITSLEFADIAAQRLGLVKRSDGKGWDAIYDVFGPGKKLESLFGVGLSGLKTEIGVVTSMRTYGRMGYQVKEGKNKAGERQVMIWK